MGSFRLNGVESHLISTVSHSVVFLKGFSMYSTSGNPVTATIARLGWDAESRKFRSFIRRMARCTQIVTVAQAMSAVDLHDGILRSYNGIVYFDDSLMAESPPCSATNQVLRRKVIDLLESFDDYWAAVMDSREFQQQCLLEMKRLAPSSDASSDDLVVFEMRSDVSFDADCMRLYRPPVLAHRVPKKAAESVYTRSVMQTPRWVHTMLCTYGIYWGEPAFPHQGTVRSYSAPVITDSFPVPTADVLAHALQFWLDAPSDGVYIDFAAALAASQLLV